MISVVIMYQFLYLFYGWGKNGTSIKQQFLQHLVKSLGEGNLYLDPLQIIDIILKPVIFEFSVTI